MNGYYEQGDPLNADGITNGVNGLHVSSSDEESDDDALNIIIPIGLSRNSPLAFFSDLQLYAGGIGSRFAKHGYRFPKPLINIGTSLSEDVNYS